MSMLTTYSLVGGAGNERERWPPTVPHSWNRAKEMKLLASNSYTWLSPLKVSSKCCSSSLSGIATGGVYSAAHRLQPADELLESVCEGGEDGDASDFAGDMTSLSMQLTSDVKAIGHDLSACRDCCDELSAHLKRLNGEKHTDANGDFFSISFNPVLLLLLICIFYHIGILCTWH